MEKTLLKIITDSINTNEADNALNALLNLKGLDAKKIMNYVRNTRTKYSVPIDTSPLICALADKLLPEGENILEIDDGSVYSAPNVLEEIKQFISNLISQEREKWVEEIKKLKKGKHDENCEHDNNWCVTHAEELCQNEDEEYGYNRGIADSINLLKK